MIEDLDLFLARTGRGTVYAMGVDRYVVRIRLPDRPGALGQVASRIGAVGGDIVAIDILERTEGGPSTSSSSSWPVTTWSTSCAARSTRSTGCRSRTSAGWSREPAAADD